ncbi:MAG TPA: hypothetical protein VLD84_01890 [Nitrososphaeraceae archaeon]|nr:hypothetical protein [Nitrososphaeraceae archaeon]
MISIGRKLFEEVDTPLESKIVSEDPINKLTERESSWTAEIYGIDPFPSGKASGSGSSLIHSNGISISSWQGKFTTYSREVIIFKGRDINKNGGFTVLRTYFTDSLELSWINGLVCLLNGEFDSQDKVFRCEGYELM